MGTIDQRRQKAFQALTKQRDALLAACKAFVAWDDEHECVYSENNPAVRRLKEQAKAAMAAQPQKETGDAEI